MNPGWAPSLTEAIETTSSVGRMMIQMVGTFAEFERAMLQERIVPARKAGSMGAARNSPIGSSPRFER